MTILIGTVLQQNKIGILNVYYLPTKLYSQHQLHPGMCDPFAAADDVVSHLLSFEELISTQYLTSVHCTYLNASYKRISERRDVSS